MMGILSLKSEMDTCEAKVDLGIVKQEELSDTFKKPILNTERTVCDNSYVLHLTGTLNSQPCIAAALSNHAVHILKFENGQLCEDAVLREHNDVIVGVKFSTENEQNLFTASSEGVVKLWDLRCPSKSVLEFADTSREAEKPVKPLTSFDVSPNHRLLIAGTALYDGDAFLLFWDVRNAKLLGGYWECHTDDITEVKFHGEDSNKLISGSTDGLINLYDLSQTSEDDALIETFNTNSSVDSLTWYKVKHTDAIACITHTNDLQLWQTEQAEPLANFCTEDISTAIKRSDTYTYLAQVHSFHSNLLIVAGSTCGSTACARTLFVQDKMLKPGFDLGENKQIVRSSWCNPHMNLLATGGEKGMVNVWKLNGKAET